MHGGSESVNVYGFISLRKSFKYFETYYDSVKHFKDRFFLVVHVASQTIRSFVKRSHAREKYVFKQSCDQTLFIPMKKRENIDKTLKIR